MAVLGYMRSLANIANSEQTLLQEFYVKSESVLPQPDLVIEKDIAQQDLSDPCGAHLAGPGCWMGTGASTYVRAGSGTPGVGPAPSKLEIKYLSINIDE